MRVVVDREEQEQSCRVANARPVEARWPRARWPRRHQGLGRRARQRGLQPRLDSRQEITKTEGQILKELELNWTLRGQGHLAEGGRSANLEYRGKTLKR